MSKLTVGPALIELEYVQFKRDADVRLPCTDGGKNTANAMQEDRPAHLIHYDPAARVITIRASEAMRKFRGITAVDRDYEIVVPVEACSWWRVMRASTKARLKPVEAVTA